MESTNHVAEETNTGHFYQHLKEILPISKTNDITVTNRRKGRNDPIKWCDIKWEKVIQLNSLFNKTNDPTVLMLLFFKLPKQNPNVSQKVRNKSNLDNESESTDKFSNLLIV